MNTSIANVTKSQILINKQGIHFSGRLHNFSLSEGLPIFSSFIPFHEISEQYLGLTEFIFNNISLRDIVKI